jgi:hypothetical protein
MSLLGLGFRGGFSWLSGGASVAGFGTSSSDRLDRLAGRGEHDVVGGLADFLGQPLAPSAVAICEGFFEDSSNRVLWRTSGMYCLTASAATGRAPSGWRPPAGTARSLGRQVHREGVERHENRRLWRLRLGLLLGRLFALALALEQEEPGAAAGGGQQHDQADDERQLAFLLRRSPSPSTSASGFFSSFLAGAFAMHHSWTMVPHYVRVRCRIKP